MSQRTTGLYRLTQVAPLYAWLQNALGARSARRLIVARYVKPAPGTRVLDLGCGPADILAELGSVHYVGIDANQDHISRARNTFGDRGRFLAGDFASLRNELSNSFDRVLCIGLLHHLDDARVVELAELARGYLAPGGRMITVDPVFHDRQHPIAHWLASSDAGRCVRRAGDYSRLLVSSFADVQVEVRHDLLRVPYSHCVMSAGDGAAA